MTSVEKLKVVTEYVRRVSLIPLRAGSFNLAFFLVGCIYAGPRIY